MLAVGTRMMIRRMPTLSGMHASSLFHTTELVRHNSDCTFPWFVPMQCMTRCTWIGLAPPHQKTLFRFLPCIFAEHLR
jgi:hypothetical protein